MLTKENLKKFDIKIIQEVGKLLQTSEFSHLLEILNKSEIDSDLYRIANSLIYHKNGIWNGGSFVRAIADNDLFRAVRAADSTMIKCIPFLTKFYHSFNVTPEEL
jgi:hypothetical protein